MYITLIFHSRLKAVEPVFMVTVAAAFFLAVSTYTKKVQYISQPVISQCE